VKQTVGTFDPKQWKPLLEFVPAAASAAITIRIATAADSHGLVALVLLIACTNVP